MKIYVAIFQIGHTLSSLFSSNNTFKHQNNKKIINFDNQQQNQFISLTIFYMLTGYKEVSSILGGAKRFKSLNIQKKKQLEYLTNFITNRFKGGRIFQLNNDIKQYQLGVVMFVAMMLNKSQKIKKRPQSINQFVNVVKKYQKQVLKETKSKSKGQDYKQFIQILKKYLLDIQNTQNLQSLLAFPQTLQTCQLICKINNSIFGSLMNTKKQYIQNFSKQFSQIICFIQYQSNQSRNQQNISASTVCIIKIDQQYLIFYQSQLKVQQSTIKITQQKQLSKQQINTIMQQKSKQNPSKSTISSQIRNTEPQNEKPIKFYLVKQNNNKQSQKKQSKKSQIQSDYEQQPQNKVICVKCSKQFQQDYCLSWNYMYLCLQCVTNIHIDTSDIHRPRLIAYLRKHNLQQYQYTPTCPLCNKECHISKYQPSKKSKTYTCNKCKQMICVKHNDNIKKCYCYCSNCKAPTLYLQKLQINYCIKCRHRYCFKCKQQGKKFCKCVCQHCLMIKPHQKQHQCQSICQYCKNKTNQRKQCQKCFAYICYGCYYSHQQKQNSQIHHQVEYR